MWIRSGSVSTSVELCTEPREEVMKVYERMMMMMTCVLPPQLLHAALAGPQSGLQERQLSRNSCGGSSTNHSAPHRHTPAASCFPWDSPEFFFFRISTEFSLLLILARSSDISAERNKRGRKCQRCLGSRVTTPERRIHNGLKRFVILPTHSDGIRYFISFMC